MSPSQYSVALIGKLGHGKTRVLNRVCGTHHASHGGCKSVTRTTELGFSKKHNIALVGTPGLSQTEDVANHIGAQKSALEYTPLSGIYLVIRCGRDGDMIDDQIFDIIDMVGEESIRIILTHADIETKKEGFDEDSVKESVSRLAGISIGNVSLVGLDTPSNAIEDFIHSTLLPSPRQIELKAEELSKLAFRSTQSRKISKRIRAIYSKIDAAAQYCEELITNSNGDIGYETDVEIMDIQQAVTSMVRDEKEGVFRDAVNGLSLNEQNICFAQAGASLSIKLQHFVENTNRFLSWKVFDPTDPRNHYKVCNHCGAIWVKVEGCDGETTCGSLPTSRADATGNSGGFGHYFGFGFSLCGGKWKINRKKLKRRYTTSGSSASNNGVHKKRDGAIIESGCGNQINWTSMRPIEPSLVAELGEVEELKAGVVEEITGDRFRSDVRLHEVLNNDRLRKGFDEAYAKNGNEAGD
jgi:hypothetical protein